MAALNILGIGDEEQPGNVLGIPGAKVLNLSPPVPEGEEGPAQVQRRAALASLYNNVTGMIRQARNTTWDDVTGYARSLLPSGQSLGEFGAGGMNAWADRDIVIPEGAQKVMLDTGPAYQLPDGRYVHRDELPRRSAVVPLSRDQSDPKATGGLVLSVPGVLGQLPALGVEAGGIPAVARGAAREVGEGVVLGAGSTARRMQLEPVNPRTLRPLEKGPDLGQPGSHAYSIKDAEGKSIGVVDTEWDPKTGQLRIADIQSDDGKNSLGPGAVRQIHDSLVAQYPEATSISGRRITGAVSADRRSGAGPGREAARPLEATPSGFSVDTSVLSPNAGTLVGKLGSNADIQLDALGLPSYRDIVPSTRTGPLTETELRAGAPKGEVFDLSETHRVPDVEQRDLNRIDPYGGRRKGLPAHITAAIEDPDLAAKLRFVAEKGVNAGGAYWYNAEPLRLAFVKELGEPEGNEIFKRYMSIVGATSAGSEVGQNVRAGSYYQFKERAGEPVQSSKDLISPYGHKMQQAHVSGYLGLGEHGEGTTLNPETQPKRSSFVENLGGNQQPVTIDKHNVRLIAMLSQNPDFLKGTEVADVNYPKLGIAKGESRNWKDEVKSGRITMDQALEHPHMWQDTPDPVHYGALEAWQQKLAKDMGLTPAQFQAALWVGGGRVTGLRSLPTSFMGIVENRLAQTAQKRGITPQQALQDWITNKAPLLSVGAAGSGLLGLPYPGEEARQ